MDKAITNTKLNELSIPATLKYVGVDSKESEWRDGGLFDTNANKISLIKGDLVTIVGTETMDATGLLYNLYFFNTDNYHIKVESQADFIKNYVITDDKEPMISKISGSKYFAIGLFVVTLAGLLIASHYMNKTPKK